MQNRTLTKSEMLLMNLLWDTPDGSCVKDLLERCPEPRPAYNTVSTFMKILEQKGFVAHRRGVGKQFVYYPLISRESYRRRVMAEVKDTYFGGSVRSLIHFFVREEQLSESEVRELLSDFDL